jgi:predicted Zn-dependent protease
LHNPDRRLHSAVVRARTSRLVLLAVLLLGLAGCVSEREEQEIGDAIAANLNPQLPLVRDPLLNRYITLLGREIAQVGERPNLDYRFYIINSEVVNAFALPGGHIYVTTGLISETETGAELAGVLAHEIGHVTARHGVQKLQRQLRTGSLVSMMYNLILGGEPSLLQQSALRLGNVLWSARHSREDEREADELAVEYLIRSGVNPEGIVTLLQGLIEEEVHNRGPAAAWFSTHPLTVDRIEHVREEIDEEAPLPPRARDPDFALYPAFLRRVAELPPPPTAPRP